MRLFGPENGLEGDAIERLAGRENAGRGPGALQERAQPGLGEENQVGRTGLIHGGNARDLDGSVPLKNQS
ncbi:MAG: hypothetical protein BWX98_02648 [Candidatus Aminicenantes bacterium ADurb.Bin147]|nr:MAG: hypothetical protein BWX98_02648 [Candidatus Aminicenantes bacterium ADurb.Bin147]